MRQVSSPLRYQDTADTPTQRRAEGSKFDASNEICLALSRTPCSCAAVAARGARRARHREPQSAASLGRLGMRCAVSRSVMTPLHRRPHRHSMHLERRLAAAPATATSVCTCRCCEVVCGHIKQHDAHALPACMLRGYGITLCAAKIWAAQQCHLRAAQKLSGSLNLTHFSRTAKQFASHRTNSALAHMWHTQQ